MDVKFLEIVHIFPELINITKPKYNKLISYGYFFDFKLVYSLAWIYKYYFEQPVVVFLPKSIDIDSTLLQFNETVKEFPLHKDELIQSSLEQCIDFNQNKVVIYGFGDFIFNDLSILNKKRINTYLKKLKCKVHILSYTSLCCLDILAFDTFDKFVISSNISFDVNYIDLIDKSPEIFNSNVEYFVDFIQSMENKSIYLSMGIGISKILQIEKALIDKNISVSRKEETGYNVIIQSSKTISRSFLKNKYSVYIFIFSDFEYPIDILHFLKESKNDSEVYIDSNIDIKTYSKKLLNQKNPERIDIRDSTEEYDSYNNILTKNSLTDTLVVSEYYYKIDTSEIIQQLDLSNLSKKDYDIIRNYVKVILSGKYNLDVKTCQLAAPCSPKDRSKKLNSLSNKISSPDYRCDVTCEIFKDYTIGIVVWNENFANRKIFKINKQTFIYQTTSGKWKYTTIN